MKISDRFTDYGLVGGLFWLIQMALWVFATGSDHLDKSFHELADSLGVVPPSVIPVLGAFGLVSIFATGLMLDFLSSYFFQTTEAGVLAARAREHDSWLRRIYESRCDYLGDNWSALLAIPRPLAIYLAHFTLWKPASRDIVVHASFKMQKYRRAFSRVHSFLLAYVQSAPGIDKLEILSTQMSLWSVARATATAILFATAELAVIVLRELVKPNSAGPWSLPIFSAFAIGMLALLYLSAFVAVSAYDRYCGTVLAFAYIVSQRETKMEIGVDEGPPSSQSAANQQQSDSRPT